MFKKKIIVLALLIGLPGIVIPISMFSLFLGEIKILRNIDLYLLDSMMQLRGGLNPSNEIVLVKIDQSSISNLGAYGPAWRKHHIHIIDQLKKAKVIAFDVLFNGTTEYDKKLGEKMRVLDNIIIGAMDNTELSPCLSSSARSGYIKYNMDTDNSIRNFELIKKENQKASLIKDGRDGGVVIDYYWSPSFIFRILQCYFGIQYLESNNKIYGVRKNHNTYDVGIAMTIPTDSEGFVYIRNIDEKKSFTEYSYWDIYEGKFERLKVKDKIVIIGGDKQLRDEHDTPWGVKSGLEVNAFALNTIIQKGFIYPFNEILKFYILFIADIILFILLIINIKKAIYILILILCVTLTLTYLLMLWFPATPFLISFCLLFIISILYKKMHNVFQPITTNDSAISPLKVVCFVLLIPILLIIKDPMIFLLTLYVAVFAGIITYIHE